jgi:two-component system, OmpR family, sensor kinase
VGVEGEDASRRASLGWLSTAVVAALAVVVCVDIWAAVVASRAAQALSANALRSVELADEMRWQLTRLTPGPGALPVLEPSTAEALRRLGRDVRAYEQLATSDAERAEWSRLTALVRDLADAWSRGDEAIALRTATGASESADRLISLNRAEADAIGSQLLRLEWFQVSVNALAGAVVLGMFAQLARARLRSLERERTAVARTLATLEAKNRELGSFAGRVAHDLRSPLAPVQVLAALLARGGQGEGDVRRIAGKIVGSTSRMSDLIEAMLAFSRSGQPPSGECAAASVLLDVLEELRSEAEGSEIRVEIPEACLGCAREVFAQIVRNLVGNALKYRSAERPCRVEITGSLGLQTLTLAVEDNGIGMEARAVRRAFEPFFRATTERPGHGLGLAIVDRYVRAIGGSIALTSRLGTGTRVEVRLPRAAALGEAESAPRTVSVLKRGGGPSGDVRSAG